VVTIAHGRHEHLSRLLWGLSSQSRPPDLVVVVAIDDDGVERVVGQHLDNPPTRRTVATIDRVDGRLPLAAARNLGVRSAVDAGAEDLVLLDVDCIPSARLVERYTTVLQAMDDGGCHVLGGEVTYLPPAPDGVDYRDLDLDTLASPHPGRPTLAPAATRPAHDLRLFWSLSFATTSTTWQRLGGFDEAYIGYGAEDTDFAQRLASHGGDLTWVGGARAYHQHHPTHAPPTQHVHDIVANANRFATRWGWWPMEGWLEAFERLGLARRDAHGWTATSPATASRPPCVGSPETPVILRST
jgi:GT2 family glycosyltransferase